MSQPIAVSSKSSHELHFTFVELLFSLAVAEVAQKTAEIVDRLNEYGATWNRIVDYMPAFSHLLLALLTIAASWVGWGRSQSSHGDSEFENMFSWGFFELLLDVLIVVVYFIMVHLVERPINDKTFDPNASRELWSVVVIFSLYFVWDIVSKGFSRELLDRVWASLFCLILCSTLTWFCVGVKSHWGVVAVDAALLLIVLLFRVLKLRNLRNLEVVHWVWATVLLLGTTALGYVGKSCG